MKNIIPKQNAAREAMSAGARKAMTKRWGDRRKPAGILRVDADVLADFHESVPEAYRRTVATEALRAAVTKFKESLL